MLQVPEEAFEKAMAGLIDLDLGKPVKGVATPPFTLSARTASAGRKRRWSC